MLQLRQSGPHLERVSILSKEGCRSGSIGVKKLDSDVMIASVALGVDPKDAKPTQCMVVKVALHGTHGIRTLYALLDTGAQGNFLSQSVAVEEGFRAKSSSIRNSMTSTTSRRAWRRRALANYGASRTLPDNSSSTRNSTTRTLLRRTWRA